MQLVTELVVLLRTRSELPAGLKLKTDTFREGWSFVRSGGVPQLEKKIRMRKWHFIRTIDESRQFGVGETSQQAISNALLLALLRTCQHFNGIEVGCICSTTYPWFVLARVGVRRFRIQQSPVQSAPDDALLHPFSARKKQSPVNVQWLSPASRRAMPLLKQALPESRNSEVRSQ